MHRTGRHPNYRQEGKPYVNEATLEIVIEPSVRVIKLKAGQADIVMDPPLNQFKDPDSTGGIKV